MEQKKPLKNPISEDKIRGDEENPRIKFHFIKKLIF